MRLPLRRASFRTRVATLGAVAVGLSVALAALVSYFVVSRQLYSQVDAQLGTDIAAVGRTGLSAMTPANDDIMQMISSSGAILSPTGSSWPVSAADRRTISSGGAVFETRRFGDTTYRIMTVGGTESGVPVALQAAHPIADLLHTQRDLRLVLIFVTIAGVAVAVALGYIVAEGAIRPVERLTEAAEHVARTQDLDGTIEEGRTDELGRLALAFNKMLAALRASRQQQAQLVSDAGHELRTPLTSLRTNIEVLLRVHDLPAADRAELLGDVRAQLEELTTLIGDIVDLARQDETQPEPTEVRLDSLVEAAVERARRRALSVTFLTHLDVGGVRAHHALLERAVLNVLDNAAKWSPPGGVVEVTLRRGPTWILDVRDHGPGIAPTDLPHIFDRFYRAESSRGLPGSGLGLAIVSQVVRSHGGNVQALAPAGGGTLMRIELPTVAELDPGPPPPVGPSGAGVGSPDASVPSAHR